MSQKVCITAVDGRTGHLIAELLLTDDKFKSKIASVVGLSLHPSSVRAKELQEFGATIVPHKPGDIREIVNMFLETDVETLCIVPPAHKKKYNICAELVNAAKKAGVPNVLIIGLADRNFAESDKQAYLREYVDIETLVLSSKDDAGTSTGHSPCVIRAGFYAENVFLHASQARGDGIVPAPVG